MIHKAKSKLFFFISHTVFYVFVFSLLALIFFTFPLVVGFGKTGKNTYLVDKDYSLLSKNQIISRLENDFKLPQNLIISGPNQQYNLNIASISAKVNSPQVANNLLFRRLNQGLSKYISAFFSSKHFTLDIIYDDQLLNQYIGLIHLCILL